MATESIQTILQAALKATHANKFKWRRTSSPSSFRLLLPSGTIRLTYYEPDEHDPFGIYKVTISDAEGQILESITFEDVEGADKVTSALLARAWESARISGLNLQEVYGSILDDLSEGKSLSASEAEDREANLDHDA